MLANNSKIEGNNTAVACADHSSHHLPHHHLRPHHHRYSPPLQSHLPHSHYRKQHDPQQLQQRHQQYQQQQYHAFEQSTESAAPHNSSNKSSSSSPGIFILSSSSPLSLCSSSTYSTYSSSYSYNPPHRQHALPPLLHNNSRLDGRTGSSPSSLPPSPLVPQTHSLHPPSSPPLSLPVPNSRQSPPAWPTIAALPTSAPIPDAAPASTFASPSISSSSLPKRTPAITTDMDIDDTTTQEGRRQHMVEIGGVREHERIELLKSDASSAMDQCEPQRGWSPSSSSSSLHSSSPSPVMAKTSSMVPVRIMKRHSYGGYSKDELPFRRDAEMFWKGDQDRQRSSDGDGHRHEYEYSDERQGGGVGKGGVLSTGLSLRAFARSQSEHRLLYRPEFAEEGKGEGEGEEGALESHRRKHARVARTDPFPRARGAMATAATLGTTPSTAGADLPACKSLVPIGPNHTIQRDRKHHSWPLVAHPPPPPVPLPTPLPSCLPLPSPSSLVVSASSPLKSPPAPDVAMAVAAPRTVSLPLPYPRSLSGTNLLKRRQSSPTPSPSGRRVPSFGYISEAQRTLYERHPPSPSPPVSPPRPPAGAPSLVGAQKSSLSLSPESLRSPKVENVQESNYVHGNAQTPMQHRLPPISKDGYLQVYERDEHEQEEDHRNWYDGQQQQQQQQYHPHDQQQRHRPTKLLPRIKATLTDDLCRPQGQLIEPPLYSSSSSSSGSSNHSFSAESSISPTYPPSAYLPPPHPSTRSSSLAQPNPYRHGQAPQQQHALCRDSYPPPQLQPQDQSHISYEYRSTTKQHQPTHAAHPWGRHGHRSSSSALDQRSTFMVPPYQQNHHLQQQRYPPGQRPPSVDNRSNGHPIHNSSVHRSLLQPSSSFSTSSSSSLHVIKNKSEGAIMVFNPQTESMTFKCELCPFESFGRIHDLKRHQTSKHKEMTWPCDFCHRPFVRRDALLRHYTVKAARDDGLHPASHEVEKLLEARARAKMLY